MLQSQTWEQPTKQLSLFLINNILKLDTNKIRTTSQNEDQTKTLSHNGSINTQWINNNNLQQHTNANNCKQLSKVSTLSASLKI